MLQKILKMISFQIYHSPYDYVNFIAIFCKKKKKTRILNTLLIESQRESLDIPCFVPQ